MIVVLHLLLILLLQQSLLLPKSLLQPHTTNTTTWTCSTPCIDLVHAMEPSLLGANASYNTVSILNFRETCYDS